MSEQQKQLDAHNQATNEFIELANQMVNDRGFDRNLVSAALMAASGIYATFITAGNEGYLDDLALDKVTDFEAALRDYMNSSHEDLMNKINDSGDWNDELKDAMKKACDEFKKTGSW